MLAPITAVLLSLLPMTQRDAPRILVLYDHSAPTPTGFIEALRIQLVGIGAVESGPPLSGDTMPAKVAFATHAVAEADAILAVWIERLPPDRGSGPASPPADGGDRGEELEFVLYVVGRDPRHALIEVFRLSAADRPMIDRALALKVRDVLDAVLDRERAARPSSWLGTDGPPPPDRTRVVLEAGWSFAPGLGAPALQEGPTFGLGLRRRVGWLRADLLATCRLVGGFEGSSFAGRVTTSELPLAVVLRATHGDRMALGAQLELGARRVVADGVTPFGATGSLTRWIPTGLAGATAALRLRPGVELRGLVGVDLALHRLRLAVNDVAVVDLGRAHPRADLALAVALP